MKKIFMYGFLMTTIFASCGSNEENSNSQNTEVSTVDVSDDIEHLTVLNENLITAKPQNTYGAGKMLYNAANDFVKKYPNHEKTPAVLELSAKGAEAMQQYTEAINILNKLINDFPETNITPNYILNKARIQEEKLNDINAAKISYNELIERFPNDPAAKDAKLYLENFLGKSDEDILKMLDEINLNQ
jgi:tetratricopeptide (TPR) repeat protein